MAAKVNVRSGETPSEQLVAEAAQPAVVTDSRGRKITLQKPSVLSQFRIVRAMGAEAAANQTYMGMVLPLIFVAEIDGEPVPFPKSELQVEALIQKLDEPGIKAIMEGVQKHFGEADAEADKDALRK